MDFLKPAQRIALREWAEEAGMNIVIDDGETIQMTVKDEIKNPAKARQRWFDEISHEFDRDNEVEYVYSDDTVYLYERGSREIVSFCWCGKSLPRKEALAIAYAMYAGRKIPPYVM